MTFLDYLKQYLYQLSLSYTTDVEVLAQEVQRGHWRLREPLALYALYSGQEGKLLATVGDVGLRQEYEGVFQYDYTEMEKMLRAHSDLLDEGYHKVWTSYQCHMNLPCVETRVKGLMREKIRELAGECDLPFDKRVLDWLERGDASLVSLDEARQVWCWVENLSS